MLDDQGKWPVLIMHIYGIKSLDNFNKLLRSIYHFIIPTFRESRSFSLMLYLSFWGRLCTIFWWVWSLELGHSCCQGRSIYYWFQWGNLYLSFSPSYLPTSPKRKTSMSTSFEFWLDCGWLVCRSTELHFLSQTNDGRSPTFIPLFFLSWCLINLAIGTIESNSNSFMVGTILFNDNC